MTDDEQRVCKRRDTRANGGPCDGETSLYVRTDELGIPLPDAEPEPLCRFHAELYDGGF